MAKWPYNTTTWRRLRAAKLARDPLCEYCPRDTLTVATEVDHRLAISKGGAPFDWDNLASACQSCHSRKTMYVDVLGRDRVPVKGCDADGRPLDRGHPWAQKISQGCKD